MAQSRQGECRPGCCRWSVTRLLTELLLLLFLVLGCSAAPVHPNPTDYRVAIADQSLDPVQSKDAIGDDVYRTKRAKFRPEEWTAANAILDLLAQLKQTRPVPSSSKTKSTTTTTTTRKPQVRQERIAERRDSDGSDVPEFNPDGTIMLQLPGKLFGNATNFVLAAAKLFGDIITNTAIRTARFAKLFQPLAGRHLFIQIPTPSPPPAAANS